MNTRSLILNDDQFSCFSTTEYATCPDCGWNGKISECEHDTEQENWESPSYSIACCPKCSKWDIMSHN